MVGQSPDSGPRGQWPEQQQLRLRDAGPNGWDMELHQHCPVTASQCHHLGLTGQARERQRQQHSPVMVDQSCNLESQSPGPESGHASVGAPGGRPHSSNRPQLPQGDAAVGIPCSSIAGVTVVKTGGSSVMKATNDRGNDETFLRLSCSSLPMG